jgi:hypothetical protein
MSLLASNATHWLDEALNHEYGIIVRVHADGAMKAVVGPSTRAKQQLYRFRQELGSDYKNIQIRLSPRDPANELWLINLGPPPTDDEEQPTSSADLTIDLESL